MTVSDILTEIILEIGGDSADTDLTTRLLSFFKSGLRRVPVMIRDRNFVTVGTYTMVADSNTVNLSNFDLFGREREVWFEGDNNIHIPIYRAPSLQYFHKIMTPNSSGKPFYYRIYGRTLQFDKKASAGLVIGIDYINDISSLLSSSEITWDEAIIEAAKHLCKMVYFSDYEEDEAKASQNERRAKEIMSELEGYYEEQEQGGYVDEKL